MPDQKKNSQMKINYLIVLPMSVEERKCFKQIWNTNMNEDRCFTSITLDYANLYENYSGYLYSVLMKYLRVGRKFMSIFSQKSFINLNQLEYTLYFLERK